MKIIINLYVVDNHYPHVREARRVSDRKPEETLADYTLRKARETGRL